MTQKSRTPAPRPLSTEEPWVKPREDWQCHCCSCTTSTDGTGTITDPDPRCHVHSFHGARGCAKHGVEPAGCDCGGCGIDYATEQARVAGYQLRAEQHAHRVRFAGAVGVDTEDTKEGLAALRESRAKAAAAQAETQQAAMQVALQPAIDAAVEAALAAKTKE